jgi:hypothetical protein
MNVDGFTICQVDIDDPKDVKEVRKNLARMHGIPEHYIYMYEVESRRRLYADTPDGRVYIERH